MMMLLALLPFFVALAHALPQQVCATITKQVIVPTKTATYLSTAVVTVHPTTAKDLGTFTWVTTLSDTTTLDTLTTTTTTCGASGIVSVPVSTTTVYGTSNFKRHLGVKPRDATCTVTTTSYTTYGQTQTWVPADKTSTYYDYSSFTQATEYSTKTGGKAYAIATAVVTEAATCGPETVTQKGQTSTVTMDPVCSPSAITSAASGFGISYLSDTPGSGATWKTNTTDASQCCQLCATAWQCAVSAWDIRTGECRLEFPVQWDTGALNCGYGLLAYYDAGPSSPMDPGTGWYVAELCGYAIFGSAKPDDGS